MTAQGNGVAVSVQSKQTQSLPRWDTTTAHGGSDMFAGYPCSILMHVDSRVFRATSVHVGKHTVYEVHQRLLPESLQYPKCGYCDTFEIKWTRIIAWEFPLKPC